MKRIYWIDYIKSFGIFLMVLCHAKLNCDTCVATIYIFHMPLFFFCSGYFDKAQFISYDSVKTLIKTLIIPYFFFSICSFATCWISPYIHPEIYHMNSWQEIFKSAFTGMLIMEDRVTAYSFMPCGPLWFLCALFLVKIFYSIFFLFYKRIKIISVLFVIILYYVYSLHLNCFSIDSAILALPLYGLGLYFSKHKIIDKIPNNILVNILLATIMLIYLILLGTKNGKIDMDGCLYGDSVFLFYFNALIGIIMSILFAKSLPPNINILSNCGQATISILGTHLFFLIPIQILLVICLDLPMGKIPVLFSVLMALISCAGGMYVHSLLQKYTPWAIGKNIKR